MNEVILRPSESHDGRWAYETTHLVPFLASVQHGSSALLLAATKPRNQPFVVRQLEFHISFSPEATPG